MKDRLAARIAELKRERHAFVAEAQQRVVAYNAIIAELERLAAEGPGWNSDQCVGLADERLSPPSATAHSSPDSHEPQHRPGKRA